MQNHASTLAAEFKLDAARVAATVALIDEGNTIPFIARYRKEATGSMDDQTLRALDERLSYLRKLDDQKETVHNSITEQGAMTPEIAAALEKAKTLAEVEDIYRPYKPKRKTRASIARARGLEPLAARLLEQRPEDEPALLARQYITEEVPDTEAAAAKMAGHRILAVDRGEREGFLKVSVTVDAARAVRLLTERTVKNDSPSAEQVRAAAEDAYVRLIHPSLEREVRAGLTERACEGAISVFSKNLRQLLLQPPIKGKVALGLDPGYRMGCKTAVVDATGKVLDTAVIYPIPEFKRVEEAKRTLKALIKKHGVEIIAIGNGTAGKETEIFAANVIAELDLPVSYMVVSEAGASVYSASKLAAEEFPEYDVNLRSAVSIARRLQDPLAELVKIDPKAVGVGQYQHDMPPAQLSAALDGVVESCVNTVGVDLNTASAPLLARVAGVTAATAKNIVKYREDAGAFKTRRELLKVPKLGPKAFEQCAGFLRVPGAKNPLDATAVHPESYGAAEKLLALCGLSPADIGTPAARELEQQAKRLGHGKLAAELGVGVPTLEDMIEELLRPGRDMRDSLPKPLLRT